MSLEGSFCDKFAANDNDSVEGSHLITCKFLRNDGTLCGGKNIDKTIRDTFNEVVCYNCKKDTDDYELVSKSEAQRHYILNNSSFVALPFLNKTNPHHPTWKPMKLYLRKHLRNVAYSQYDGEDHWKEERKKRDRVMYEKHAEKTRDFMENSVALYKRELKSISNSQQELEDEPDSIGKVHLRALESGTRKEETLPGYKGANKRKRKALTDILQCIRGEK
jgi:DNA repair protein